MENVLFFCIYLCISKKSSNFVVRICFYARAHALRTRMNMRGFASAHDAKYQDVIRRIKM